jgi:hypothetical protein
MEPEFRAYRAKFNRALEPMKVMLVRRKSELDHTSWLALVELTKTGVVNRPEEYLGEDVPPTERLIPIIDMIFREFLNHQLGKVNSLQ